MREAVRAYASKFIDSYYFIKNKGYDPGYVIDFDLRKFLKGYANVSVCDIDTRFQLIWKIEKVTVDEFIQGLNEMGEHEIVAYVINYFYWHGINTSSEEL